MRLRRDRAPGAKKVFYTEGVLCYYNRAGHLAQLGEHFLDVEGVRGSSPLVPTKDHP